MLEVGFVVKLVMVVVGSFGVGRLFSVCFRCRRASSNGGGGGARVWLALNGRPRLRRGGLGCWYRRSCGLNSKGAERLEERANERFCSYVSWRCGWGALLSRNNCEELLEQRITHGESSQRSGGGEDRLMCCDNDRGSSTSHETR